MIRWQHKTPAEHPVEPRYAASGKWVCYVCRGEVTDGGRAIDMTWKGMEGFDALAAPQTVVPDSTGLQEDGS